MPHKRYNDYYLVNDEDLMSNDEEGVEFVTPKKRSIIKRILIIVSISLLVIGVIAFILAFIIFPLVFKFSLTLQQSLVFTRWNLVSDRSYFINFRIAEFQNHYIDVIDVDNKTTLQLGLWHMLPTSLAVDAIYEESYDFKAALRNSNFSVLLYFHGTGEDRSQSWQKYQLFRDFFHVIAFDYRGYGDSQEGPMFERNIVNDCVQVYKWVQERTDSPIYVWGHSLGTPLATGTLTQLGESANVTGVILEAAFTSFRDELYHHPYTKYFSWLPWFESTIVNPLTNNGFIFNTSAHVLSLTCPIMFMHAKDDSVVPYFMSEELYAISNKRDVSQAVKNQSSLILFNAYIRLDHYFIYRDSFSLYYVYDFLKKTSPGTYLR
ncbi:lysophosphatidylserine lipase ABHD12-like [Euwallacea fornicatus]|uniref:lysophosphatidylserine lipase ABHD12-like n=1 Tax=Euwallacea fornicatus TaxID=995702 RepID=UPI00338DC22F